MPLLQIYLVEDSPVIRESLIATLEELAPVKIVGSAEDEEGALQWLAGHHSDLVIVDLFLKGGSGLGVLRAAQQGHASSNGALNKAANEATAGNPAGNPAGNNSESAPVSMPRHVVLSNYATPAMRERCLALGADGVFDKSTEIDSLIAYCTRLAQESE